MNNDPWSHLALVSLICNWVNSCFPWKVSLIWNFLNYGWQEIEGELRMGTKKKLKEKGASKNHGF